MRYYLGIRPPCHGPIVLIFEDGFLEPLDPAHDVWKYGCGSFDWGKAKNGCRQLALALLVSATGRADVAVLLADRFLSEVLRFAQADLFSISQDTILLWVAERLYVQLGEPVNLNFGLPGGDNGAQAK